MSAATHSDVTLSILLPVRNEGINLRTMLKLLRAMLEVPHEVLVVHDDPEDDAVSLIASLRDTYTNVHTVRNDLGRGVVNAIKAGVARARGEYVLIFAADEVGPVLAIDDMLALMRSGCDVVSCTRYAYGGRRLGGSLIGGFLSRRANALFDRFAGSAFTDATTGIKMLRRDVFERLELESPPVGWVVAFEIAIKAQLLGLRLGEVPIISIDRLYGGKSTFRLGPWFVEYLKWFIRGAIQLRTARQRTRKVQVLREPTSLLEQTPE